MRRAKLFLMSLGMLVCGVCAAAVSEPEADALLRDKVSTALHAAPYFYDAHVNVTVEHGKVILRGFVMSDWDLRDALRIAGRAADGHKVVNELSIKVGGRR